MSEKMLGWRGKVVEYRQKLNKNSQKLRAQALLNATKTQKGAFSTLESAFWKWKIFGNKKKVKLVVDHLAEHSRMSPYNFYMRILNQATETL